MRRENAHRVIGVDVAACCMQVSVSPPRAKGAGRVPLWRDEMVGYTSRPVDGVERLAGAKRGALEAGSLWFGLRPFDFRALIIVTGNRNCS
jgi:hypothetical protein